ncbi:hypothetical protein [Fibrella aquatilis]|uniref:PKD domain-containing protein n=1 Tax=Fibrella aquatilis TaxID=2817059 RepID=A0A939G152_9BACT|nr:hypothetical protein [Fibrella aquatilis]MBO0930064.1 hypothetical protein [Fibrella aquatilis]
MTTLNVLAQFAGYADWRTFRQAVDQADTSLPATPQVPASRSISRYTDWRSIGWIGGGILLLILVGAGLFRSRRQTDVPATYRFGSRPVTQDIPNSVIFTYDATASPTDSVFIQQSWDPARRQQVSKTAHEFTSLYYYPGSYEARLLVGRQIVSRHTLTIPTAGWLGLIHRKPVPIYLEKAAIIEHDFLRISPKTITAQGIALQPVPPTVQFYNVGNFKPTATDEFTFSCQLQNEGGQGAGICQHTAIALITERSAINIPLCRKGCIAALTLFCLDTLVSGKTANLASFGTEFGKWVGVRCQGDKRTLRFYVNDRLAYELPAPKQSSRIVGMAYSFEGTGAVRKIKLTSGDQTVFQAF